MLSQRLNLFLYLIAEPERPYHVNPFL